MTQKYVEQLQQYIQKFGSFALVNDIVSNKRELKKFGY